MNRYSLYSPILLLLPFLLGACAKKEHIFPEAPAERVHASLVDLQNTLVDAPNGWTMLYFPRADALLFSYPKKPKKRDINNFDAVIRDQGYGGYYFPIYFEESGKLRMLADYDGKTCTEEKQSAYRLEENTYAQLTFSTYNYVHRLVNDRLTGVSDFLYYGRDTVDNLVFRSANSIEPAQEFIILKRVGEEAKPNEAISKALENREFFARMRNPQLKIYRGDQIFFQSDRHMKGNKHFTTYSVQNRYYLFEADMTPNTKLDKDKKSLYLGSGYIGTEEGLYFYPGIRYSQDIIFYEFKREGDTFTATHVDLKGEELPCYAVIWDQK